MPAKTRKGAPRKSQARASGFYGKALEEAYRESYMKAVQVEGLDDEVAVLRVLLRRLLREHPDEVKLQLDTVNILTRTLRARYQLAGEQNSSLKDAIYKVMTEIAIPLGIKFLPGPK